MKCFVRSFGSAMFLAILVPVSASAESTVNGEITNSDVKVTGSANKATAVMGNANANMGSVRIKKGADVKSRIFNNADIDDAENKVYVGTGNIDSVVYK